MNIYDVNKPKELKKAIADDLIKLNPSSGCNALYIPLRILQAVIYALATNKFLHISGPTGTAKTALIEAISLQSNYKPLCLFMDLPYLPIRLFRIPMVWFESSADVISRRCINEVGTYDENSMLIESLLQAEKLLGIAQPVIWLREGGRVIHPSVQSGLLDLMAVSIVLPSGLSINGEGICWCCDSNYAADSDRYTQVKPDSAWMRRFPIREKMPYLDPEAEHALILDMIEKTHLQPLKSEIEKLVSLGNEIREQQRDGNLLSLAPPTIDTHLAALDYMSRTSISFEQAVYSTLLGNPSDSDEERAAAVYGGLFGRRDDPSLGSNVCDGLF